MVYPQTITKTRNNKIIMKKFLLMRLIGIIPMLIGISIISFAVIHLAPGEPSQVQVQMNPKANKELHERLKHLYGLDKPLTIQYLDWLKRMMTLNFGKSLSQDRKPVLEKIGERLPITILLNVIVMAVVLLLAIPIGIYSAYKRGTLSDQSLTVLIFIGFATPNFWLALLLMIFFGIQLGILPISGIFSLNFDSLSLTGKILDIGKHLILPVFSLSVGSLAYMSRYVRASILEVMRQDYITTARAKGLGDRDILLVHTLKNALMPVITILGLSLPGLIGGSVITESIFAIPGMGRLFYNSVYMRDYTTIMGILVISSFLTLLGNILADLSYALVDPRIREGIGDTNN